MSLVLKSDFIFVNSHYYISSRDLNPSPFMSFIWQISKKILLASPFPTDCRSSIDVGESSVRRHSFSVGLESFVRICPFNVYVHGQMRGSPYSNLKLTFLDPLGLSSSIY